MIQTNDGYKFESSDREILTYGSDCISIDGNGLIRYGYDGFAEFWDDQKELYHSNFTKKEKKELALFMIAKWQKFGGL